LPGALAQAIPFLMFRSGKRDFDIVVITFCTELTTGKLMSGISAYMVEWGNIEVGVGILIRVGLEISAIFAHRIEHLIGVNVPKSDKDGKMANDVGKWLTTSTINK
jgi:hypothetical protein